MSKYLKVEGHDHLVRESSSHAIINADASGYSVYMRRVRAREQQGDQIRNAVKEINNLIYIYHLNPSGFILISAQDSYHPIIGYSFDNSFSYHDMPDNFNFVFKIFL